MSELASTGTWRHRLVVVLVGAVIVVAVAWIFGARTSAPADGTVTYPSAPLWRDGATVAGVIGQSGLRRGDLVTAIDGIPLETWVKGLPDKEIQVGQRLVYQVFRERSDSCQRLDVAVTAGHYPFGEMARRHLLLLPLVVFMLLVTGFALVRRPGNTAVRALFATTALLPIGVTNFPLSTQVIDLVNGPRLWPTVVGDTANALLWASLLHFALVFPEPRAFLKRRPRLVFAVYALPFVLYAGFLAINLPFASTRLEVLGRLMPISTPAARIVPFLVAGAIALVYREAKDPRLRRQIRWTFGAIALAAVCYVGFGQLPDTLIGRPLIPWVWLTVTMLPFPIAIAVAIVRYRLFDVSVIVKRSLVYGGLTAALISVYFATVLVVGLLFGVGENLAPMLAIGLVAVLFQPLRSRLTRVVGKYVFGDRDDPHLVLTRLGEQLEARVPAESVLSTIVQTLAQALRLPYAAIQLVSPEGVIDAARWGRPQGTPMSLKLIHRGEEIGRLVLDTGPSREPFGAADRELLETLAQHVGTTAHNVLLNMRLQRSVEQVVTAREEERRRLRRDLHDELGPSLAANSMRLDVARKLLRSDVDKADEILAALAETQLKVIADVRRLVENLRPPVLDQLGLEGAIRERAESFTGLAETSLVVEVETEGDIGALPAAAEVAAYHIAVEAITNVVRHADARRCTVRLSQADTLLLDVSDDGRGLPASYRAGIGLHSMRERATQLGGTLTVTSAPGTGTTIRARLPLTHPGTSARTFSGETS